MSALTDPDPARAELREAYEMGRRDADRGRRRHPVLMTLTVLAAAIGIVLITLAIVNGSFGGAGSVVDQNLAEAADKAEPVVRGAAAGAGEAFRDATTQDGTQTPVTN
ncbi:MAG: hypothetical protein U1C74_32375 [Phenylobacterium sp.]|nr:hypothetical protein [Phenylobacterium sp.]